MIPVTLEIEGLFSYRTPQLIDFTRLTSAGLFGIFGPVGSGKSTILEAMLLALYGATERLSQIGERTSMINLQSDKCQVKFTFKAGSNHSQLYQAVYLLKKKKSKKNDAPNFESERRLYVLHDGQLQPEDKQAEDVIGMKMKHFLQTIIIPQGKFREFIDLAPKDRWEMMRQLFHLDRFELNEQSAALLKKTDDELLIIKTQLAELNEYTEERKNTLLQQIDELNQAVAQTTEELHKAEIMVQQANLMYEKYLELQRTQQEVQNLELKNPEIEEKRAALVLHQKAVQHFKPVWQQIQLAQNKMAALQWAIEQKQNQLLNTQQQLEITQEKEATLKQKVAEQPQRERKINDLKKLIQIMQLEESARKVSLELDRHKPQTHGAEQNIKHLKHELSKAEQQLSQITCVDADTLAELKSLHIQITDAQALQQKAKSQVSGCQRKVDELTHELNNLIKQLPPDYKNFEAWLAALEYEKTTLETSIKHTEQLHGLAAYAHLLQPDEPCPLCGAHEHPTPLRLEEHNHDLELLKLQLAQIQQNIKHCQALSVQSQRLNFELQYATQQLQDALQQEQNAETRWHQLLLTLKTYQADTPEHLQHLIIQEQQNLEKKKQAEQHIKDLHSHIAEEQATLTQLMQTLTRLEAQQQALNSQIQDKNAELDDPNFVDNYRNKSAAQIENVIATVKKDIDENTTQYEAAKNQLEQLQLKHVALHTELQNLQNQLTEWQSQLTQGQQDWQELLRTHPELPPKQVLDAIENPQPIEQLEKTIKAYDEELLVAKARLSALASNDAIKHFDTEAYERNKAQLQALKASHAQLMSQLALCEKELAMCQKKLEEKAEKMSQLEAISNKKHWVEKVHRLLKGGGFIKYISSIFLQELCAIANQRFVKLTKNQLQLTFEADGQFYVIDYLNGGKKRLLKTLSGGQTFQAALSLALALAEQVKTIGSAGQSFFFIDEGFGALDKDSLATVFDTLKSLQAEHRVVGIISHVDELQQEIPVYAKVSLDAERGSLVTYSV